MSLSLDHLVVLVHDLEQAIADYAALGFTVQRGGTHADGVTHNALVGFADGSYLELISFLKPPLQHRWAAAAIAGHKGFVDYALLPPEVASVVTAARARGLVYAGPVEGGRVRPDGARLAWQIGTPPSPDLPFLCGDVTPRAQRVREGSVRQHPNGVQGVAAISVAVHDLEASLARYRALLGSEIVPVASIALLPGLGVRVATLALGRTKLALLSPLDKAAGSASDADEAAALRERLARRGEGVLGVALRSTTGTVPTLLPLARTHGARFEVHPE